MAGADDPLPDPVDRLVVTTAGPRAVAAGRTATYVVTLTNWTNADIRLDPCPGYVMYFSDGAARVHGQLDCSAARVVPAQGARRFAMRITAPTGGAGFQWRLDTAYTDWAAATHRLP